MASRVSNYFKWVMMGGNPSQWAPYAPPDDLTTAICSSTLNINVASANALLYLTKPGFVFNPNTDIFVGNAYQSPNITANLLPSGNGYTGSIQQPTGEGDGTLAGSVWQSRQYAGNGRIMNISGGTDTTVGDAITLTAIGGSIGPFSGMLVTTRVGTYNGLVIGFVDFTTPTISSYTQPAGGTMSITDLVITWS